MKQLIIIILFPFCLNAQVKSSEFYTKQVITGIVEINGRYSKNGFIFEAGVKGIRIYDGENKEYTFVECNEKGCKIIHLKIKNKDNAKTINNNTNATR
jgi:hypothetical protein